MNNDIKAVLVTEDEINKLCKDLGNKIYNDYKDKNPLVIGLLKGCQPFMSDLLKNINCLCEIDYMKVSSYCGTKSTGSITIKKDIDADITGRDVILVDDIVETGYTISCVVQNLMQRGAKSVNICCLLDKPAGRKKDVVIKYPGMCVPDEFVVGYGLDYNEKYRNLNYIGVLKEEVYQK